ncbi:MAG: serine/threonine protein kinase, partial [Planctomycetes bacterium]|nr:serine/threonine protein kinase [Planctomycetota bacterium]
MGGAPTPPPFADLIGRSARSSLAAGAAPAAAPTAGAPESLPAVLTPGGARGPLSGASWEDYLVGDLIAAGGMGEVYRAVQRPMGRVVALKVIPAQGALEAVRRFRAEARAVAMIQHPNVVAVYASGERDGRPFLAMELLTGGTLAERLALRRADGAGFSPYEAADLVLQAARGLAAAHACELVHRDLKPANLLFAGDGALKVCDFGLARMPGDGSRTLAGTVLGTPLYMSPEQGRGLPATPASDVYGLGVVLYELLTMAPPFEAAQAEALVLQHNFSEPALPSVRRRDLPAALEAVCLKCLQKRPQDRFADGAALVADLERVRAGLAPLSALFPPGQMRTGAEEALRRLSGRRRWWRVAVAAGVAAAAAATLLWWREGHQERTAAARSRLEAVLAPAPIPASAAADLDLLAQQVGADDPLV